MAHSIRPLALHPHRSMFVTRPPPVRRVCSSNRTALRLSAVSVLVVAVLCLRVACHVIKVEVDGGRTVTSACDFNIVGSFGVRRESEGCAGGWGVRRVS